MRIKSSSRPQRPLILPHLLGGHRVCKDRLRQADETFVAKQPTCRFLFRTFATWLTHNASTVPCFPLLPFNFPLAYVLSSTSSATPNAGSLFSCSGRERVDRDRRAREVWVGRAGWHFSERRIKATKNGGTDEQVAREPFYEETKRQRLFNWYSEMHFDSASAQIQSPGAIWERKRKEIILRYNDSLS